MPPIAHAAAQPHPIHDRAVRIALASTLALTIAFAAVAIFAIDLRATAAVGLTLALVATLAANTTNPRTAHNMVRSALALATLVFAARLLNWPTTAGVVMGADMAVAGLLSVHAACVMRVMARQR